MKTSSPSAALRWALPSWTTPGTAADNARLLEGRVPEIGLCFFETAACLAYGEKDIPPAGLRGWSQDRPARPMRYHVHLPADFDWESQTPARLAETAFAVFAKAERLAPDKAVLHPPADMPSLRASTLLAGFIQTWRRLSPARVLLENIRGAMLCDLDPALFGDEGFGVCLDAGHLMGYRQDALLASPLPRQAELFHWSAPGGGDRHRPLTELLAQERETAVRILGMAKPSAVHLIEVFDLEGALASYPVLTELLRAAQGE